MFESTTTRPLRASLLSVALGLVAATSAAQTTYRVIDVGRLATTGAYFSFAEGVSDLDHVVGFTYLDPGYHGFLFVPTSHGLTEIGDLPGGEDFSRPLAVNHYNVVVGWSSASVVVDGMPTTLRRAFRWSPRRGIEDIGADVNPEGHSFAVDVNLSGQVAGHHPPVGISTVSRLGFLWEPGGAVTHLPHLDPMTHPSMEPRAVDESGLVVGVSSGGSGSRAFQWDVVNGVATVPGDTTAASAAEDAAGGAVVGTALVDDGMGGFMHRGMVLHAGQLTLLEPPPGALRVVLAAVNSHGQAAGSVWFESPTICIGPEPLSPSCYADPPTQRAVVWSAATGLVDLSTQLDPADPLAGAVVLTSARDINDHGSIAANGYLQGQGGQHAFLLVPTAIFMDGFESSDTTAWSQTQP